MTDVSTPPSHDSKTNLLEAARAVVKDQHDKAEEATRVRLNPAARKRVGVLSLLSVVGLLLLVLRPPWLAGPAAPPKESPAVAQASVRLSMLREQQRVLDFLKLHGRLPASLVEAGGSAPGIGYEADSGQQFRIFAQAGDSLLVLRSTDSMTLFLGNSLRDIKNRVRE